ncbi:hypothetical protein MPEAHAMD_3847 [Methylobacterium frigidaeris]|uniref:Uncharacterized protein n=1 Tax=Methylobacterium frigidaeris TaxID=2038277 RepID=A0AA37HCZ5_9HYPH|nr:hypothetical protein MPEAHAMD_3847 [Methylobacterium frigidaeris]
MFAVVGMLHGTPYTSLPTILLGEVRKARLDLFGRCPICYPKATIPAMEMPLPYDLDMNAIGHRMRCTDCGRRGGMDVSPIARGGCATCERLAKRIGYHGGLGLFEMRHNQQRKSRSLFDPIFVVYLLLFG